MSLTQSLPSVSLLSSCTNAREIQQIHAQCIKTGLFAHSPSVAAKITQSLCQLNQTSVPETSYIDYAVSVFDHIIQPSCFLYNTLIRTHNQNHQYEQAFLLFYRMLCDSSSVLPDNFTFPFVLKSCAQLSAIEEGEQVHCFVLKTNFILDVFIQNSLMFMYARCRKIGGAYRVFDEMSQRNVVSWNSMIDGSAKTGDVDTARAFFDAMPDRNIVSWNSMLAGYMWNSLPHEALDLFLELQNSGLSPDESTLVTVVSVISDLGLLGLARRVHGYLTRHEFSLNGVLGAALVDMYSKCGSICTASQVFESIPNRNVVHWTAMIVGFAIHGYAKASLQLFSQMEASGVKPNCVTFIGVLIACSHAGLVKEGLKHFSLMTEVYGINPAIQHYGCLVDLLGRAGYLEEAKAVIENMPLEPGVVIWATLLSACRNHGNITAAEIAAQKLSELAPNYGGCYVLLSNLYAGFSRWEDFSRVRSMMEERRVEKVPGFSWIEVDGEVHEFVMEDRFHPRSREIYGMLDKIDCKLRWAGFGSVLEGSLDLATVVQEDLTRSIPSLLMDYQ